MSKQKLEQTAQRLFAKTAHTVIYGVASCNEFFTSKNAAQNACKKGEKPIEFTKSVIASDESEKDVKKEHPDNAKNTIVKIEETTSLEALSEFETDIENRKSVLAAIEKQKAKLIAGLSVQADSVNTDTTDNGNEDTETDKEQSKTE